MSAPAFLTDRHPSTTTPEDGTTRRIFSQPPPAHPRFLPTAAAAPTSGAAGAMGDEDRILGALRGLRGGAALDADRWRAAVSVLRGEVRDIAVPVDGSGAPAQAAEGGFWDDSWGAADPKDHALPAEVYACVVEGCAVVLESPPSGSSVSDDAERTALAEEGLSALRALPEFRAADLSAACGGAASSEHAASLLLRLGSAALSRAESGPAHAASLVRTALYVAYECGTGHRAALRRLAGRFLGVVGCNHARVCLNGAVLSVVGQVLCGLAGPPDLIQNLLRGCLLPLHAPNEMTLWRDQSPVLGEYHKELVFCMLKCLEKCDDARLRGAAIGGVLEHWPSGFRSNTPKQVLLLHELETLLSSPAGDGAAAAAARSACFEHCREPAVARLCEALGGENFRPIERALLVFRRKEVMALLCAPEHAAYCLPPLLRAIVRPSGVHWNPTVNRMAKIALEKIREDAPRGALAAAAAALAARGGGGGGGVQGPGGGRGGGDMAPPAKRPAPKRGARLMRAPGSVMAQMRGAGFEGGRGGGGGRGVGRGLSRRRRSPAWRRGPSRQRGGRGRGPRGPRGGRGGGGAPPPAASAPPADRRGGADAGPHPPGVPPPPSDPLAPLDAYLAALGEALPPESSGEPWHEASMAAAPTLLPSLKFHDLVFGASLGSGAFSTVRYARRVRRDGPAAGAGRSSWPEYAVKQVSREVLERQNYASACLREVAALRMVSHPGAARLVSAFLYRGSAFLVLEYAALGDLHSLLAATSRLAESAARFVAGSAAAAVAHLHEIGLVFGDLKPENVLLTMTGHVKVADFGAARPFTPPARDRMRAEAEAARSLRSGDWKEGGGDGGGGGVGGGVPSRTTTATAKWRGRRPTRRRRCSRASGRARGRTPTRLGACCTGA